MKYKTYLNSNHWKNLRAKAFVTYGKYCQCCLSAKADHVHHLTYRGDLKKVTVKDLRPVCEECHSAIHAVLKGLKPNMPHMEKWDRCVSVLMRPAPLTDNFKPINTPIAAGYQSTKQKPRKNPKLKKVRSLPQEPLKGSHKWMRVYKEDRAAWIKKVISEIGWKASLHPQHELRFVDKFFQNPKRERINVFMVENAIEVKRCPPMYATKVIDRMAF